VVPAQGITAILNWEKKPVLSADKHRKNQLSEHKQRKEQQRDAAIGIRGYFSQAERNYATRVASVIV
jgi:hypothetical protein